MENISQILFAHSSIAWQYASIVVLCHAFNFRVKVHCSSGSLREVQTHQ